MSTNCSCFFKNGFRIEFDNTNKIMYLFDYQSLKVPSKNLATSKCPPCLADKIILSLLLG